MSAWIHPRSGRSITVDVGELLNLGGIGSQLPRLTGAVFLQRFVCQCVEASGGHILFDIPVP